MHVTDVHSVEFDEQVGTAYVAFNRRKLYSPQGQVL